ncbi:MAG TPA: FHA domain-containing protein [Solirubrobacteraceae bacterium]|jgi:pSer/pThr/pTyr-binding forkhead associated (FHA) protein|nr:FHA domain-containing protein [Solirubrobacteraceae bacterium]
MTDDAPAPAGQPVARTTADVQALIAAERGGQPFLTGRIPDGHQVIFLLSRDRWRLTVGRKPESDVALGWDAEVSRAHALLERVGDQWTLVDDGLSSNGSFVNGRRVAGRQRLRQGDRVCFGNTQLLFRDPGPPESEATRREPRSTAMPLTPTQHKVLVALCRPLNDGASTLPATNKQIADEVFLSVDAVKAQLRLLFERFGLAELAQNEKRARLAQTAFSSGVVAPRDF